MSADYYVFSDQQYGPYDVATIRGLVAAGRLDRNAWVFHNGETSDWTRAAEIPSLQAFFPIAIAGQAGEGQRNFARKLDQAQAVTENPPSKPLSVTAFAPPDAASQVHKMDVNLPDAPLSDLRHPHESIQILPPNPPPTPGRWLTVLQKLFGSKTPP
jgi:hypothetical protein